MVLKNSQGKIGRVRCYRKNSIQFYQESTRKHSFWLQPQLAGFWHLLCWTPEVGFKHLEMEECPLEKPALAKAYRWGRSRGHAPWPQSMLILLRSPVSL